MQLEPGRSELTALHDALSRPLPGAVVVLAGAGAAPGAVWGQILTRAVAGRGAVGAVVDGPVRDRHALAAEGLLLWGGPPATVGPAGQCRLVTAGTDVRVGDLVVHPGDTVVLDADGIVVLDPSTGADTLAWATAYAAAEDAVLDDLAAGRPLAEAYRHKRRVVDLIGSHRPPRPGRAHRGPVAPTGSGERSAG